MFDLYIFFLIYETLLLTFVTVAESHHTELLNIEVNVSWNITGVPQNMSNYYLLKSKKED